MLLSLFNLIFIKNKHLVISGLRTEKREQAFF